MKQTKVGRINKNSAIYNSEVYEYLAHHKISFETLTAEDAEEFKARAKASADADERRKMARRYTYMKQAIPVKSNWIKHSPVNRRLSMDKQPDKLDVLMDWFWETRRKF